MSNSNHYAGAHWVLKLENLTSSRSKQDCYYKTLCQFYTYFSQFYIKMDKSLAIFNELLITLNDSLV